MAYIVDSTYYAAGSVPSGYDLPLPINQANDYVIIMWQGYQFAGGSLDYTTMGWSLLVNNNYQTIIYKKITTPLTSVSLLLSGATTKHTAVIAITVRGADGTTPFDAVTPIYSNTSTNNPAGSTITTNTNNALVINMLSIGTNGGSAIAEDGVNISATTTTYSNASAAFTYQQTAGLTQSFNWITDIEAPKTYNNLTFSIRDDGSNLCSGYVYGSPATVVHFNSNTNGSGHLSNGTYDPTTVITTITNGSYSTSTVLQPSSLLGLYNNLAYAGVFTSSATNYNKGLLAGKVLSASRTFAGKLLSVSVKSEFAYTESSKLGWFFGLSDGTNTRFWQISGIEKKPNPYIIGHSNVIEIDGGYEMEDQGTVNTASIDRFIVGGEVTAAYRYCGFGTIYLLNTLNLVGGTSSKKSSFSDMLFSTEKATLLSVINQNNLTQSQLFCSQSIQLGNASLITHFDSFGQSVEFPSAYNSQSSNISKKISQGALTLTLLASASDSFSFGATVLNLGNFHNFLVSVSSSPLATYDFNGLLVINATVTLQGIGSAKYAGITFSGCKEIALNGFTTGNTLGACTISNCVDAQAVTVTSEAEYAALANCIFKNSSDVAILITGDQTGVWQDRNITFSGNVNYDIKYTGTTAFSIQSANAVNSTYTSGVLTIIAPETSFAFNVKASGSLVTGYEWRVYTVTTPNTLDGAVEIHGEETATLSSQSFTHTYTSQAIALQVLHNGYEEFIAYFTLNSTDINYDVILSADINA